MAAKVVEANAGVHTLAISVAVSGTFLFPRHLPHIGRLMIVAARNELASIRCVGKCAVMFLLRNRTRSRLHLHRAIHEHSPAEPRWVCECVDFERDGVP